MMEKNYMPADSYFAPAARATLQEVAEQRQEVLLDELLNALMQSMSGFALLLNVHRQIVAVNQKLLDLVGVGDAEVLVGKRSGEIINCIHLDNAPGGCGTSQSCSFCGALLAVLEGQETNEQVIKECRITVKSSVAFCFDMQAMVTPITIRGQRYFMLNLRDISSEKRLEVLERVFFHDVMNTAGGIHGLASMLYEHDNLPEQVVREYRSWLVDLTNNLLEEIQGHRKLLAAERGEFVPKFGLVSIRTLLKDVFQLYNHHEKTPGRFLNLADGPNMDLVSDVSILRRIIGNMVINALEATPVGGTVTLSASSEGQRATIEVHNPGVIPDDVQLQIFGRSFSTKASTGRGIGTYCMKLFGERYLKGKVSFRSSQEEGTVFSFSMPLE